MQSTELAEWHEEQSAAPDNHLLLYLWHSTLNALMLPIATYSTEGTGTKLPVYEACVDAHDWLPHKAVLSQTKKTQNRFTPHNKEIYGFCIIPISGNILKSATKFVPRSF